jgi:hypothetical protein
VKQDSIRRAGSLETELRARFGMKSAEGPKALAAE